jgi:hypothetical protein
MERQNWVEQRRTPRWPPREDVRCRVDVRARVRVVDISATGALLATDTPPRTDSAALLKTALGAATFASEVQIRRTGSAAGGSGIGVSFTTIDERSRRSLEQFLKKASA